MLVLQYYTVSQKVPTLKLSVTLSNLNRFSNFFHCRKAYKFATKPIRHYPPHLRHVATLPWEIKNAKSVTLSDLEQPIDRHYMLFHTIIRQVH